MQGLKVHSPNKDLTEWKDILISEGMIRAIAENEADSCRKVSNCDPYLATKNLATSYKGTLDQIALVLGTEKLTRARILEIGSGNGFTLCYMVKNGVDVVGIEPGNTSGFQERYLRAAQLLRENGITNPENYLFDACAEKIPFPDNTFDLVFSSVVLEHVQNLELAMQESIRVLKPGGVLWASVPNYNSWYEGHYKILWIPYIMTQSLAKLYVSRIFNRDPAFISELIFTNPSMFRKYLKSASTSGQLYLHGNGLAGRIFSISNLCLNDKLIPASQKFRGLKKQLLYFLQNNYLRYLVLPPLLFLSKFLKVIGLSTMFDIVIYKK